MRKKEQDEESGNDKTQLTEPVIAQDQFCDSTELEFTETFVRIVGIVGLLIGGSEQPERRIIIRMVLTNSAARDLAKSLSSGLARGGH